MVSYMSGKGGRRRLFELYEYDGAGREFISHTITALARAKHPVLREIQFRALEHDAVSAVPLDDGTRFTGEPLAAEIPLQMDWVEATAGNLQHFIASLDKAADEQIGQVMPQFYKEFGRMLEATGQSHDAGGRPMSWDLLLEMYEKLDIEFDDDGKAKLPMVVMPPKLGERLGPPPKEFLAALDEMLAKKRKGFDARRRTRRIS